MVWCSRPSAYSSLYSHAKGKPSPHNSIVDEDITDRPEVPIWELAPMSFLVDSGWMRYSEVVPKGLAPTIFRMQMAVSMESDLFRPH